MKSDLCRKPGGHLLRFFERHPILVDIIAVLGCSSSSLIIRQSTAPSVVTATWRLLWTVLLLTPVVWGRKNVRSELLSLPRRSVFLSAVSGVFLAIHFLLWFESLRHTSIASATVLVATEVIWVAIGYRVFLKGRLGPKAVAAILITLLGSALIAYSDSRTAGESLFGDMLALTAAIAFCVNTLIGRVVREKTSTSVYTYIAYVFCALTLGLITLCSGESMTAYGWNAVVIGLLLAVLCTVLGHSCYSWCLKYFSPAFVSATKLCQPVVASLAAAVLLREFPVPLQIVGGLVVLAGVIFYSYIEIRKEKTVPGGNASACETDTEREV